MKFKVTYILPYEEKGKIKEKDLGSRELFFHKSKHKIGPKTVEALAFRRASREQLDATKLKIRNL